MTDNLATILEREIRKIIGAVPMSPIEAALKHTFAL